MGDAPQGTIRRATVGDVETLARLRHEMQKELHEGSPLGADPDDIVNAIRTYFQKELRGAHFAAFFAERDGEVAATGALVVYDVPPGPSNPSGTEACIMNMYTVPGWRRHGLATLIMNELIRHGYQEGARRFWLRASEHGRAVYQKLGFETPGHYMQKFVHYL
ncbi:MAG TPA: GNAT family N-acetyltransferase [Dehalococcoidia bacterium]|nr:GNAT family N-acetyltransferase [Dehalococcoidia bacterium]